MRFEAVKWYLEKFFALAIIIEPEGTLLIHSKYCYHGRTAMDVTSLR